MWLGAVIARRIWHQRKTPGIHISGSGRLRWVSLHPAALSSWSRTTFSVGLHASRRHGQLHGNNPAQNLGPSRLCILDTAFVRYSLSASILGAEPRPITIAFRIWNLHCQAQRRVQPRRADGEQKAPRRRPGVGCHVWFGAPASVWWRHLPEQKIIKRSPLAGRTPILGPSKIGN